ncbi:MAG: tetratricopeptide repeat protein [Candidatus Hydrogenedentes bacterium]|nr:tetratricopeptide repeat protein [Candidatus Hydrogenedentota bacterium]
MRDHVVRTARTYVKNFFLHAKRMLFFQETFREAWEGISGDSSKLARAVKGSRKQGDHHLAARLVEKGRKAYNSKRYEAAEGYFRKAILEDTKYALAYSYLGSTMYKQEKLREAILYWTKAIEAEPGSDAATRAERSLKRVSMQKQEVITALEDRID